MKVAKGDQLMIVANLCVYISKKHYKLQKYIYIYIYIYIQKYIYVYIYIYSCQDIANLFQEQASSQGILLCLTPVLFLIVDNKFGGKSISSNFQTNILLINFACDAHFQFQNYEFFGKVHWNYIIARPPQALEFCLFYKKKGEGWGDNFFPKKAGE